MTSLDRSRPFLTSSRFALNLVALGTAAVVSLLGSGCSSAEGGSRADRGAVSRPALPPRLEGTANFFGGIVTVTASDAPPSGPGSGMNRGGMRGGGGGGGERRGEGTGERGRRGGGPPPESDGASPEESSRPVAAAGTAAAMASPLRHLLLVSFHNSSSEPIEITIHEVKSVLGNFAPRPEKITLEAGQSASLEPMLSSFEERPDKLELSVTLKRGPDEETQRFVLKALPPPPSPGSEQQPAASK